METIIIDGTDTSLGRLASHAAKQALLGRRIVIVNCSQVLITGNKSSVIAEWREAARRGGHSLKGPFLPRKNTERIVKRTIRGMLSYRQQRGFDAFQKIMCYPQVPTEYASAKKISLSRPQKSQSIKLSELSKQL